jgi:hypothetical protein
MINRLTSRLDCETTSALSRKTIALFVPVAALMLFANYPCLGADQITASKSSKNSVASIQNAKRDPTDTLIVQLSKDADEDKFKDLLQEVGGTLTKRLDFGPDVSFLFIQTEPGTVATVEAKLRQNKEIQIVQRNLICNTNDVVSAQPERAPGGMHPAHTHFALKSSGHSHKTKLSTIPNDPEFPVEWDLGMMNWPLARLSGYPTGVPVAMYFCDTGVDYQPPEIGTTAMQFNCFDPPNSIGVQESLFDSGTHGTSTTTVTAATDNGICYSGMANFEGNRITLVMCRITNGGINTATVEGVLTALNFIYVTSWFAPGPINVSVNSTPPNTLNSLAVIQAAALQLRQKGFLVVLAAGNASSYDSSPELYARRVLAISQDGLRASFSNYGPFNTAAPGDGVPIYIPGGIAEYFGSGTSLAAPRWCAAIAAVMGVLPANLATASYADSIVSATATTTPEGYKIPNLSAALKLAASER